MISLFILIVLLIELYLNRNTVDKSFVSPQCLMTISFIPSLVIMIFYEREWDMQYNIYVIFALIVAPILVGVVSAFSNRIVFKKIDYRRIKYSSFENIGLWKYLVLFLFELISVVYIWKFVVATVGNVGSIANTLVAYNYKSGHEYVDAPPLVNLFRMVTLNLGYFYAVIISYYVKNKKVFHNNKMPIILINYILSYVVALEFGARGTALELFFASAIIFVMIVFSNGVKISLRKWGIIIALVAVGGLGFQNIGTLMGRVDNTKFKFLDYISLYTAAPIKNFSMAVSTDNLYNTGTGISDNRTFVQIINWIALKFGPASMYHQQGYPSHYINGKYIGNVYTAYSDYMCDGGVVFFVFCILLMAIVACAFYKRSKKVINTDTGIIPLSLVIYSKMGFYILFSFFANEFYLNVAHIEFFRSIIMIWAIRYFLLGFNYSNFSNNRGDIR